MNSLKPPCHSNPTRPVSNHSPESTSSTEGTANLSHAVRFHDLIPTPQKVNDREKYLTAWVECHQLVGALDRILGNTPRNRCNWSANVWQSSSGWMINYDRSTKSKSLSLSVDSPDLHSSSSSQEDDATDDHDHCPGDLIDSLLDMENESERQTFLLVSSPPLSSSSITTTI